jgi:hypothetical protein
MKSALLIFVFVIPLVIVLASILLLAACGGDSGGVGAGIGGGAKGKIAEETWDYTAENAVDPEIFEETMLMMFPTAGNLEEAKKMYIYVSSAAPVEEPEAARDEFCGAN